jgi:hypothetical protein
MSHWRGDTWVKTFTFTQGGVAYSLAGATPLIHIRKKPDSADTLLVIDTEISVGGVDNNVVSVSVDFDIAAGSYFWDLQLVFADGTTRTFLWGSFELTQDITR